VFLERWLERYPQFKGRELYLTGESYAGKKTTKLILFPFYFLLFLSIFLIFMLFHILLGHYVPQLAHAIVHSQKSGESNSINLKGYMVIMQNIFTFK
jgi:serine carboxypeptidase-like clade II